MKATIIALIITVAAAWAMVAGIRHGQMVADMERRIQAMGLEIEQRQVMLDDARDMINHLEREIHCVDYEYSTREFLWLMADQFRQAGLDVEFH